MHSNDPTIFLIPKHLFRQQMEVPADVPAVGFGQARVRRGGDDVTVVTWGNCIEQALAAAEKLAAECSVEVIDLRSIMPWDKEMVFESVKKTSRVLVAHEDSLTMGFGAEVAACIADECFEWLDAPVGRVGAMDCFVPSATNLELEVLPSVDDVRQAAERLLSY